MCARRDERAETPEAANVLVKALRQLFNFALEYELAQRNPAKDVPYLKSGSEGFYSWSLDDVRQFEKRHPVGSKARLALALVRYAGPFTPGAFGNWFRKRCDEAGLENSSAHDLRKVAASIAAENGATERQLMAIFRWSTLKEAAHYTRAARQKVLAASGMKLLNLDQNPNETVPLFPRRTAVGQSAF